MTQDGINPRERPKVGRNSSAFQRRAKRRAGSRSLFLGFRDPLTMLAIEAWVLILDQLHACNAVATTPWPIDVTKGLVW